MAKTRTAKLVTTVLIVHWVPEPIGVTTTNLVALDVIEWRILAGRRRNGGIVTMQGSKGALGG
jgi:hypothetical protein